MRVVRPTIAFTVTDGEFRNLDHAEPSNSETPLRHVRPLYNVRTVHQDITVRPVPVDPCPRLCKSDLLCMFSLFEIPHVEHECECQHCDIAWFIGGLVI